MPTRLSVYFLCLFITACAKPQAPKIPAQAPSAESLAQASHWLVAGRLVAREPTKTVQLAYLWQQLGNQYTLDLQGPLGLGHTQVTGSAQFVQIKGPDGRIYSGRAPQTVLREATGLELPLLSLAYWIRGLPDPQLGVRHPITQQAHYLSFEQAGWHIRYVYAEQTLSRAPRICHLREPMQGFDIRIVLQRWQVLPSASVAPP